MHMPDLVRRDSEEVSRLRDAFYTLDYLLTARTSHVVILRVQETGRTAESGESRYIKLLLRSYTYALYSSVCILYARDPVSLLEMTYSRYIASLIYHDKYLFSCSLPTLIRRNVLARVTSYILNRWRTYIVASRSDIAIPENVWSFHSGKRTFSRRIFPFFLTVEKYRQNNLNMRIFVILKNMTRAGFFDKYFPNNSYAFILASGYFFRTGYWNNGNKLIEII